MIASARNSRKYRRFRQHHNTNLPKSQRKCSPIHQCCCNLVLDRNLSNEPLSQSVKKTNVSTTIFTFSVLDRLINVVSNCSNLNLPWGRLKMPKEWCWKWKGPEVPWGLNVDTKTRPLFAQQLAATICDREPVNTERTLVYLKFLASLNMIVISQLTSKTPYHHRWRISKSLYYSCVDNVFLCRGKKC